VTETLTIGHNLLGKLDLQPLNGAHAYLGEKGAISNAPGVPPRTPQTLDRLLSLRPEVASASSFRRNRDLLLDEQLALFRIVLIPLPLFERW